MPAFVGWKKAHLMPLRKPREDGYVGFPKWAERSFASFVDLIKCLQQLKERIAEANPGERLPAQLLVRFSISSLLDSYTSALLTTIGTLCRAVQTSEKKSRMRVWPTAAITAGQRTSGMKLCAMAVAERMLAPPSSLLHNLRPQSHLSLVRKLTHLPAHSISLSAAAARSNDLLRALRR